MADTKISADGAAAALADADIVPVVQGGLNKKATALQIKTHAQGGAYVAGGTDVPVTDGGTGASTAAAARTNLAVATLAGNRDVLGTIAADSVLTTFAFTGIAATYKALEFEFFLVGHGATLILRVGNGGTVDSSGSAGSTGKYQLQSVLSANAAATISQSLLQTGGNFNPSLVNDSSFWGKILNYASAAVKMFRFDAVWGGVGSGSDLVADYGVAWNNSAVIDCISLICASAPTAGYVRLYGVN